MKILIACEYSGIMREAFLKYGHDVTSCDFLPTEQEGKHYQGNVLDILYQEWDLIIAHPSCKVMTNSGVRWLYNKDGSLNTARWEELKEACEFFNLFINHPCKHKVIENPVPHKHAKALLNAEYSQIIQPYEYGHTTSKKTCLWTFGLPLLTPTHTIPKDQRTYEIHKAAPSPDRWKDRSRTFTGIAEAMAKQYTEFFNKKEVQLKIEGI